VRVRVDRGGQPHLARGAAPQARSRRGHRARDLGAGHRRTLTIRSGRPAPEACKILPDAWAGDPERIGRFEREANKKTAGNDATAAPPQIVVVQHFDQELKRLVPAK
jgi:hypothetical protein